MSLTGTCVCEAVRYEASAAPVVSGHCYCIDCQKEAGGGHLTAAFKQWVDDLLPGVPPKTALGKALAYTTRQWEKLSRFLSDPEMPADNNYCENQIRPFAVGRRSWLFVDSQLGAKASAKTAEQIEALLPWNAKAALDAAAAPTDAQLAA